MIGNSNKGESVKYMVSQILFCAGWFMDTDSMASNPSEVLQKESNDHLHSIYI